MNNEFWLAVSIILSIFSLVVNLYLQYVAKDKNIVSSEWELINGEWKKKKGN